MSSNADYFLKKSLGDDFFESLVKFELWKPGTKTTVDHEEIKTALMIVPRTLMSFLIHHLSAMEIGENKETQLPIDVNNALMKITKHERDVYSGEIIQDNKRIVDFKYRSIPGVGLVIMSAFELYDTSKLIEPPKDEGSDSTNRKIQDLIDERLALHDLIGRVADKKILERDAVHQLFLKKLSELVKISRETAPMSDPYFRGMANGIEVVNSVENDKEPNFVETPTKTETVTKKESPLRNFLDKRKDKSNYKAIEFSVKMQKNETINCPDCGKNIFNGSIFSGCVCLGQDMDKKIFIKKTEEGVKIRFGRSWDKENIEMLLEVLRKKRG